MSPLIFGSTISGRLKSSSLIANEALCLSCFQIQLVIGQAWAHSSWFRNQYPFVCMLCSINFCPIRAESGPPAPSSSKQMCELSLNLYVSSWMSFLWVSVNDENDEKFSASSLPSFSCSNSRVFSGHLWLSCYWRHHRVCTIARLSARFLGQ